VIIVRALRFLIQTCQPWRTSREKESNVLALEACIQMVMNTKLIEDKELAFIGYAELKAMLMLFDKNQRKKKKK